METLSALSQYATAQEIVLDRSRVEIDAEYVRLLEDRYTNHPTPEVVAERIATLVNAIKNGRNGVLQGVVLLRTIIGNDTQGLKESKDLVERYLTAT
jgi:hypothetical protein